MPQIDPKNLTAQLNYRARGNPPSTQPHAAISNCFPGLETDFRNAWKRFLVGIEFHEATNNIAVIEAGSVAQQRGVTTNHVLTSVAGINLVAGLPANRIARLVDWANLIADVLPRAGEQVPCEFRIPGTGAGVVSVALEVRRLLSPLGVIEPEAADPGVLTQSLCSPWQADYRECACFYWAASRPDFVNVETTGNQSRGHNWLHRNRTAATPKNYAPEGSQDLVTYDELYRNWEAMLRFEFGGRDEE
jgi:hypothetical protein